MYVCAHVYVCVRACEYMCACAVRVCVCVYVRAYMCACVCEACEGECERERKSAVLFTIDAYVR